MGEAECFVRIVSTMRASMKVDEYRHSYCCPVGLKQRCFYALAILIPLS